MSFTKGYTLMTIIVKSFLSHDFSAHTDLSLDILYTWHVEFRVILDLCNIKIFLLVILYTRLVML